MRHETSGERNRVRVAHDEILLHVERRECFAKCGIEWIHCFADIGGLIFGFAVRVAGENVKAFAVVAQRDLQAVVTGIADGGLIRVATEVRAERPASPLIDVPVLVT